MGQIDEFPWQMIQPPDKNQGNPSIFRPKQPKRTPMVFLVSAQIPIATIGTQRAFVGDPHSHYSRGTCPVDPNGSQLLYVVDLVDPLWGTFLVVDWVTLPNPQCDGNFHSFQGSFFLENLRKPRENGWFLKSRWLNNWGSNQLFSVGFSRVVHLAPKR